MDVTFDGASPFLSGLHHSTNYRKGEHSMKNMILGVVSMGFAAMLCASPVQAADDWSFSLTPYLWLPTIDGQLTFNIPPGGGGSPNVEAGPDNYLENLDFALMLAGEARKGRMLLVGDLIYLNFAGSDARTVSVNLPGGGTVPVVDAGSETSLKGALITLGGGYNVYSTPRAQMDVFGGLRYLTIEAGVDWRITGPVGAFPPTGSIKQDKDVTDGIVGVRGRVKWPDSNWSMPYHFDVGTGSSDLTWQAILGASYSYSWGDVTLAYRHLEYDFGNGGLVSDLSFSGPALGATFHF